MRLYESYDYNTIFHWCALRDKSPPPAELLPPTGIIVDNVACGFLVAMNNNCAMLDFYISNPNCHKKERDYALNKITQKLIHISKEMKMKMLFCNSQNEMVKKRALRNKFTHMGDFTHFKMEL